MSWAPSEMPRPPRLIPWGSTYHPKPEASVRSLQSVNVGWSAGRVGMPSGSNSVARAYSSSGLPAASAEAYATALAEPGAWTGAFNWYRGLPFSTKPVGRVRVPTTYVWGRNDAALVRSTAEATAKYVAGHYRFVELDAGHWLPETEPAALTAAILDRIAANR